MKLLNRSVAFLLIPCLMMDPAVVHAMAQNSVVQAPAKAVSLNSEFASQALVAKILGTQKVLYRYRISGRFAGWAACSLFPLALFAHPAAAPAPQGWHSSAVASLGLMGVAIGVWFGRLPLKRIWRHHIRSWVNLFGYEARHGLLFFVFIQIGTTTINFLNRGAQLHGFSSPLLMALLWIPGTLAYTGRLYWRGKLGPLFRRSPLNGARLRWYSLPSWLQKFPFESILLFGLASQAGYLLTFAKTSPVSANAILMNRPIIMVVLAVLTLGERLSGMAWVAFALSFASSVFQIASAGGYQWIRFSAGWAVLTLTLTSSFYGVQKFLVDRHRVSINPTRLTFFSGVVNSVAAVIWLLIAHRFSLSVIGSLVAAVPVSLFLAYAVLSGFNLFLRYERATTLFQNSALLRISIADFFSQPLHAIGKYTGFGLFTIFGLGAFFPQEPGAPVSVTSLVLAAVALVIAFFQADIRLQRVREQRMTVYHKLGAWTPAVGFLGSDHPAAQETVAEFGTLLAERGLPPRTGDPRPLTDALHHAYLKAREALGMARLPSNETQAIWDESLFERRWDANVQRLEFLAHHAMRKLGFLVNLHSLFAWPGGFHTLDKVFQAWYDGHVLFLVEPAAAFWSPLLQALQAGWAETGHRGAVEQAAPRVVQPAELRTLLNKLPRTPRQRLPNRKLVKKLNDELAQGIRRIRKWDKAVVMVGDPKEGTPELEAARQTARALFDRGIAVRVEGRGDLYKAIWQEASGPKDNRRLMQSVINVSEDEPAPTDDELKAGPESYILTHDSMNHNIFLTKYSRALLYYPGPLRTLSTFFDTLTYMQENPSKRHPLIAVGKTRFWGPTLQALETISVSAYGGSEPPLIPKKDLALITPTDTAEETLNALALENNGENGNSPGNSSSFAGIRRLINLFRRSSAPSRPLEYAS